MAKKTYTIEYLQEIAKGHSGKCLSKTYTTSKAKYKFKCELGHIWEAQACQIWGRSNRQGSWCPECQNESRKDTINTFKKIAISNGGICLSSKYIDSSAKLKFQCSKGHTWEALPGNIKNSKAWCLQCTGKQKKNLSDFKKLAIDRGGECLSIEYISIHRKLKWKCALGHIWEAAGAEKMKGKWCPECSSGFGERVCRLYFEKIFKVKFPKSYPDWLSKKTGDPRELDGYNEKMKIAFEYNGRQHYVFVKSWHKDEAGLAIQKKKDSLRRRRCKANDVKLIEIPEINWKEGIKLDYLGKFLENEFKKANIKFNTSPSLIKIDLKTAYSPNFLLELIQIAKLKKGKCLADAYLGSKTKLRWQCHNGHKWDAPPASINQGNWCPTCLGRNGTIQDMQLLAKSKGGKCLSTSYKNSSIKLRWQCRYGHIWKTSPTSVKTGRWCRECSNSEIGDRTRLTLSEMKELAKSNNGRCLSKKYIDAKHNIKWECSEGHKWEAKPLSVKRGSWCSICKHKESGINKRDNIENMILIAKVMNGKCLSKTYTTALTKLKWKCKKGHIWMATPASVKHGSWCSLCGNKSSGSKRRATLEEFQKIASIRGGKCLSKTYVSSKEKLKWECSEGHTWSTNAESIKGTINKKGTWCPKCSKRNNTNASKKEK